MGRFDGVIIVSDIDGTFLGKDGRLVPENMEAIEYFKRNGGSFTVATGRESFLIHEVIPQLEQVCNIPMIACNGAYIYDAQKREIVLEEFLPEPDISRAVDSARARFPGVTMRISCGGEFLIDQPFPIVLKEFDYCPERVRVLPYERTPHGCWHKVVFEGTAKEMQKVREELDASNTGGYVNLYAIPEILEMQSVRGTKGAMLAPLKRLIGRPDASLYAIGDYENDVEMLEKADFRATPANGLERLKQMPGMIQVCHHDEGAIADLIRHIEKGLPG